MKLVRLFTLFIVFFTLAEVKGQIKKEVSPSGSIHFSGYFGHKDGLKPAIMVANLSKEQVLKECTFFGGDSLNGFDFDAASKQAELEGDKMYLEFRNFMHRTQANYVMKKYNISELVSENEQDRRKLINPADRTMGSACNNLDFENGDMTGWNYYYGYNSNSNGPFLYTNNGTPPPYNTNGVVTDCKFYELISSAYGNDYFGGFPGLDAGGGTYCARLGGDHINLANYNGGYYCNNGPSSSYSSAEDLAQTFKVTTSNALFSYNYAVILNDGGHANGQQPYFRVLISDSAGNSLPSCYQYYQQVSSGVAPPGYSISSHSSPVDGTTVYYLPWTGNSVNLSAYINHTINIDVVAAGCIVGGHFGYGYIDASCGPVAIATSNATPCSGGNVTLTAPPISGTYHWYGTGVTGATTQTVSTSTSGTYSVVVTPSQGASCSYTLTLPVTFQNPTVTVNSPTICSGPITLTASGATSYSWSTGALTSSVSVSPASTTVYTVTGTSSGCSSSATSTVTVNSVPTVSGVTSQTVCSGAAVATESFTSSPTGATFAWTNNNTNIGGSYASGSGSGSSIAGYTAPGVATQQVGTIVVTPTLAGCVGTPSSFNITINPLPTVSGGTNQTICSGAAVAAENFASSPAGGTFAWVDNNLSVGGLYANGSGSGNIIAGYTAPSVASQQVSTVTVTPTLNSCTGTPSTFNITINPLPTVSGESSQTVCSGGSVVAEHFTSNPIGGTFTWSDNNTAVGGSYASGSGSGATIAAYTAPIVASQQVSTVTITPSLAGCTGTPASFNITINPLPTVTASSPTVCSGSSVNVTAGGAVTYTWNTGSNANPLSVTPGATSYTVTGTSAVGCTNTAVSTVTVEPLPSFTLSSGTYNICSGGSQILNVSGASSYTWTPAATLINANTATPTASPTTTTTYSVTGTSSLGCTNLTPAVVTVNVAPAPTLSLTGGNSYTICTGGSQTLSVAPGLATYTWTSSPAGSLSSTSIQSPVASPTTTTIYTVSGTSSGCSASTPITCTITVNPLPTLVLSRPASICLGGSSTMSVSGGSTYTWSPAATLHGANTANPTATPTATTTYSVVATSSLNCSNTVPATVVITVNPLPTLTVTPSPSGTVCSASSAVLTASGADTYSWSSGPTTSTVNVTGVNSGTTATTNTVSVTGTYSATGCSSSDIYTLTVSPTPTISLVSPTYTICSGGSTNFSVTSSASSYTWTAPAGGSITSGGLTNNPTITATNTTAVATSLVYTVTGSVGTCTSVAQTITLTVNPKPTVTATSPTVCSGSSVNITAGGASTYTWNTGSTHNPLSVTPGATSYTVTGTSAVGCTNTAVSTVTVEPLPSFTLSSGTYNICSGGSQILNVSGASSYTWTPAATLINANTATPTASPTTTTTYSVTGTSSLGCTNLTPAVVTVNVAPAPTLSLTGGNSYTICTGGSQTLSVAPGLATYTWTSSPAGSLSSTSIQSPVASPTTTTIYTVSGTSSGCSASTPITCTITVNPLPTLVLSRPASICLGGSSTMSVSGGSTYTWSPAATLHGANTANPTATPTATTTYSVVATSSLNCSNTVPATVVITVNPLPTLTVTPSPSGTVCSASSAVLTASGADTYSWSSGPTTSTVNVTGVNSGTTATTNTVSVTGTYSATGCSSSDIYTLTVSPTPTISLVSPTYTICSGGSSSFSVNSTVSSYTWIAPSNGSITSGGLTNNPTVTGTNTTAIATALVYTVTSSVGTCTSTAQTVTLTVLPNPVLSIIPSSTAICAGATATLTGTGASSYTWTAPTGSGLSSTTGVSVSATPTISSGTLTYTLTATNANTCTNTTTGSLVINTLPTYSIASNNYTICGGGSQTFSVNGVATSYTWTSNPPSTITGSNTANPTVSPTVNTTYSVTGTTSNGCVNPIAAIITVTVDPTPTLTLSANSFTMCAGSSQTFTVYGASVYTWTPTNPAAALSNPLTYTPTASPSVTTIYTVTGAASGCLTSNPLTVTLTVVPLPVAPVITGTNNSYCQGSPLPLTVNSSTAQAVWYQGNNVVHVGSSYTPPANLTAGTYTYSVIDSISVSGPGGCVNAPASANTLTLGVTVKPLPAEPILTAPTGTNNAYCVGLPNTLTVNSGTAQAVWYQGNSVINHGSSYTPPTNLPVGTYTYSIIDSVAVPGGCISSPHLADSVVITLHVNGLPTINTSSASIIPSNCSVPTGSVTNVIMSGNQSFTYTWTNTFSTPTVTNTVGTGTATSSAIPASLSNVPAGNYYLYVTDVNGCVNTSSVAVSDAGAPSTPTLSMAGNTTTYCQGQTILPLIVNVANSGTTTPTVNWSSSNTGSPILAGGTNTNTYTPSGIPIGVPTTIYAIAVANGCSSAPLPVTITINAAPPAPVITGTANPPLVECQGVTPATLSVTSTASVIPVWYVGTNIIAIGSTYTPSTATPTNTIYTISDSSTVTHCTNLNAGNSLTVSVTIVPAPATPTLSPSIPNPLVECQGVVPSTLSVTSTASVMPVWYVGTVKVDTGSSYTPSTSTPTTTIYIISDSSTVTGCTNLNAGNTLTVSVQINPAPLPPVLTGTASNPLVECQGVTPATLSVTTTASVIPVWYVGTSTVAIGQSYTPSTLTPGSIIYIISDSSIVTHCTNLDAENTLKVVVQINAAPLPPVLTGTANSLVECQGVSPATLSVTTTASVIPVWYVGTVKVDTGSTYTPSTSTPTTTIYTISDSSTVTGCTNLNAGNALTVSVTINAAPGTPTLSPSISNPLVECQGVSPTTLSVTASASAIPVWYVGTTVVDTGSTYTPSTVTTGTTTYVISDSSTVTGCKNLSAGNSLTVTVHIVSSPTISVQPLGTGSVICNGATTTITPTGATSYTLIPGNYIGTSFTVNPSSNITYTINGSIGSSGCVNTAANADTTRIIVNPTPTISIVPLGSNSVICNGGSTIITPTMNSGAGTYTMNPGNYIGTSFTVNPSSSITYTINGVNNSTGCKNTASNADTTRIIVNPTPTIGIASGTNSVVCNGGSTVITPTMNPGLGTYTLNPGNYIGTSFTVTPSAPITTYTITGVNNATGCFNSSSNDYTTAIAVNPTPTIGIVPLGSNSVICSGQIVTITPTINPVGAASYTLNPGNIANPISFTLSPVPGRTTYTITGIDVATGCPNAAANADTFSILVHQTPTVSLNGTSTVTAICNQPTGGVTGFSVNPVNGGMQPYNYIWTSVTTGSVVSTSTISPTFSNEPQGTYSLEVTDAYGCIANVTGSVSPTFTVPSATPQASFTTNLSLPDTGLAPLAVSFTNTSTGANQYVWSFGDTANTHSNQFDTNFVYNSIGVYTVTLVASFNGACPSTSTLQITVDVPTTITIPNIFSPNGDGINDEFFIINTGMTSLNCQIFNRWGQLLATLTAPNQSWDGRTPNGDKAPEGTYMYILQAQGLNGKTYKQDGTVTLVR